MLMPFIVLPFQRVRSYFSLNTSSTASPSFQTPQKEQNLCPLPQRNCKKIFNCPPGHLNFHKGRSLLHSLNYLHQNLPSANESTLFHKSFHVLILIDCLLSLNTVLLSSMGTLIELSELWLTPVEWLVPVTCTAMENGISPLICT